MKLSTTTRASEPANAIEAPSAGRCKLVVVTPARNEADLIENTIQSVIRQKARPLRWVIVSDGSTDGTDDIVRRYAEEHPWIELVCLPPRRERHFAGKVMAFNAGYARLRDLDFDVLANLDADITFDDEYFAFVLDKLARNPRLGVAGTPFSEHGRGYDYRFTSVEHVSGGCQFFRRECFEEVGGYTPIEIGGVDLVAVMTARMKGWQTRTFTEKPYAHHRRLGTAKQNAVMVAFRGGHGDYRLGGDPLWEFCRCLYQTTRSPIVLGGLFRWVGFMKAMLGRAPMLVSDGLIKFRRAEQRRRLRAFLRGLVRPGTPRSFATEN